MPATLEERQFVIDRLTALKTQMPLFEQNIPQIMTMQGNYTIDQIIEQIAAGTRLGDEVVEAQLKMLREVFQIEPQV